MTLLYTHTSLTRLQLSGRHLLLAEGSFVIHYLVLAMTYPTKEEGWLSPTEGASVSAISLRHNLASPAYATGTIAVNVTWMERGFNAIYLQPFTSYSQYRYWSEIATFSYPVAFNGSHWKSRGKFGPQ